MQLLQLDFFAKRRASSSPWMGRVLFAVALAFGAHVTASYIDQRGAVDRGEAQLAQSRSASGNRNGSVASPPVSPEEMRAARETIERLSLAWDNLFSALEASPGEDVALLSIEPDPRSGTAIINGEGKDYASALRYVSRLGAASTLRNVYLVKHEQRPGESRRPLAFSVSAAWKGAN